MDNKVPSKLMGLLFYVPGFIPIAASLGPCPETSGSQSCVTSFHSTVIRGTLMKSVVLCIIIKNTSQFSQPSAGLS